MTGSVPRPVLFPATVPPAEESLPPDAFARRWQYLSGNEVFHSFFLSAKDKPEPLLSLCRLQPPGPSPDWLYQSGWKPLCFHKKPLPFPAILRPGSVLSSLLPVPGRGFPFPPPFPDTVSATAAAVFLLLSKSSIWIPLFSASLPATFRWFPFQNPVLLHAHTVFVISFPVLQVPFPPAAMPETIPQPGNFSPLCFYCLPQFFAPIHSVLSGLEHSLPPMPYKALDDGWRHKEDTASLLPDFWLIPSAHRLSDP